MCSIKQILQDAVKKNVISSLDYYFSCLIADEQEPVIMIIAVLVSQATRNKNICISINTINTFFKKNYKNKIINKLYHIIYKSKNWISIIKNSNAISDGIKTCTPLILSRNKIYLYRMWKAEKIITNFISKISIKSSVLINYTNIAKTLKTIFYDIKDNNHQHAILMSILHNITFILGGPGTGKTTITAKLILSLIKLSTKKIKIQLAAPTGKAAARLNESLNSSLNSININDYEKKYFPLNAITLHRLLKINSISQKPYFCKKRTLDMDVLIIDETSMIDVSTMAYLIQALPKYTKVIFLGDYNQLPSVESGSILKDIFLSCKNKIPSTNTISLNNIQDYYLKIIDKQYIPKIQDCIHIFKTNYRFHPKSRIKYLAEAILKKNQNQIKNIFENNFQGIKFYSVVTVQDYTNMLKKIIKNYDCYLKSIKNNENIKNIFSNFKKYKILCVIKNGLFGLHAINQNIECMLKEKRIVQFKYVNNEIWYIGKPIMITKNCKSLNLFNGEIGITMLDKNKKFKVYFLSTNNILKKIEPELIMQYNVAWSITIHKSQGSEFSNIGIILPQQYCKIMTKELLYTAVTRAKKQIEVYGNINVFLKASQNNIKRESGLID